MPETPRDFTFLLAPQLSMMALAAAVEPLRLANRVTGKTLYDWRFVSEDGGPVRCSNHARIEVDGGLVEPPRGGAVVVASGLDAHLAATPPVLNWLRRESRKGIAMGALCTGTVVLARAGLLEGRRCTIHWENQDAFREEHLEIDLTARLYEIDGDRFTCAGGVAATDMMLEMIARDVDAETVAQIADQVIHTPSRGDREDQRLSVPARIGVRHPRLVGIVQAMEESLEDPVSPSVLAAEAGMSTRQLERLFRRYLNRSPKRYYMELRLKKARNLLLQTEMSVINVALACGFTSPSHFSKCYRAHFGRTPYRERGAPADARTETKAAGR